MSIISHLNIEVTRYCNQGCFYCFNESGSNLGHTPYEPSQWLKLLTELGVQGLKSVHVTGGEPFLWWGTIELLHGAQTLGLSTSILSNGSRIPHLIAEYPGPFSRLHVAQISLDSMSPAIHDSRRGMRGAWQVARRAINALRTLGVPVEISAVISETNLQEAPRLADYCADIGAKLLVRPLRHLGRAQQYHATSDWTRELPNVLDKIAATWPDVLTLDAFSYLPQTGELLETEARQVATMHPEGLIRSETAAQLRLPQTHFLQILRNAA